MKTLVSSLHLLCTWYLTSFAVVLATPCTTYKIPAHRTCIATCTQPTSKCYSACQQVSSPLTKKFICRREHPTSCCRPLHCNPAKEGLQGLGCEVIADPACTQAHREISPWDERPPSAPRNLNISTRQRDGHLWLRISWQLSVDASVQLVNSTMVQMLRQDLTSTCVRLRFEHPIHSQSSASDGKPWSFMYDCFSVNVGETVTVNVYNMPHGNGALHTLYTAPGCNNAEVQGLPECTGQTGIAVNVDTGRENVLRVSYSSSIPYTEYTVVTCSLFLVCKPLHRQRVPGKENVVEFNIQRSPCLCVEVYAVEMHDCRVRTCPFREDPIKPNIMLNKDGDSLEVFITMLPAGCSFSLELTLLTDRNLGKSRVLSKTVIHHRHQVVADNYLLNETMCTPSPPTSRVAMIGAVVIIVFILLSLFLILVCWKRRKQHSPPKGVLILYMPDSEPFRKLVLAFSTFLSDSYGLHVTLDLWCSREIATLGPSVWLQKQLECFRSDSSTLVILPSAATHFKWANSIGQLEPLFQPHCLTPETGNLFSEAVASLRSTELRRCVVATFFKVTNSKDVPSYLKDCPRFCWPSEATLLRRQLGVLTQSHGGSARHNLESVLMEAQKWRQDYKNKKRISKKLLKSEKKAIPEQMMMSEKTEESTLQTKLSSSRDSAFFSLEV
uniref:interleukin-17 receptor B-like isoform X2 n=1 Tax=Myxine glutinosa TaxID=7769 RepID=UPI0035902D96